VLRSDSSRRPGISTGATSYGYTHDPEPYHGLEAFQNMLARTHHFFPGLRVEVRDVVTNGTQVVVCWTYRGIFQNGGRFGGGRADNPWR